MPNIYIERKSYEKIILLGKDPRRFVNDAVKEKLLDFPPLEEK